MNFPEWVSDAVFYQIFPERFWNGDPSNDPPNVASWETDPPTRTNFFGGDLAGIIEKTPHLQRLGVDALYLTPIFSADTNHKYDTRDYMTIDPAFGTLETFRQMLRTLHAAGVRLLLDAVFNHCGDGFWAFRDVIEKGKESPYYDWFKVASLPIAFDPPSYQTCGGAPFLPKLNTDNPSVCQHLLEVTEYWLREGIDGWRLDVPWKVPLDFWREFRRRALAVNPQAYFVSEVWRGTTDWVGGDTVHGVMNYRLRQLILDYAAWDHLDAEDFDYELHQLIREHGETVPYHLTLLGSHDTPRIRTLCKGDIGRTRIAITLQMTLPGAPMVYYGDEIGMEGETDPDCRRPMIWDESRWCMPIFETTQRLIRLRKAHPALRSGEVRPLHTFNGVYCFARIHDADTIIVVLNPRMAQPEIRIALGSLAQTPVWVDVLSGERMAVEGGELVFRPLPPGSAQVFVPESRVNG